MSHLANLLPYLKKYRVGLILGFFFIIGTNAFHTLVPKIMGKAVDELRFMVHIVPTSTLLNYAFMIVGFTLIQGIFRFFMRYTIIGISRKIEYDYRNDFFRHLQNQPQDFFDKNKTGDLMSRAINDLNAVRMVLGPGIMYMCNTIILFSITLFYMTSYSLSLTFIALSPFPVLAFLIFKFGSKIHYWFEKIQAQMSNISSRAQENLSGIRIVKAYARQDSEVESFKKLNSKYISLNQKLIRVWSLFFPTIQFISGIGFAIVLWYGGSQVIAGTISLGDFVAFHTYLLMLLWPIISIGWVVNIFERGGASMRRLNNIMTLAPAITDEKANPGIQSIDGDIEIRNLSYSYNGSQTPILSGINLKIPKGKTAAIIGPTGCGKSTLINLIPRVYDPPEGTIFIDGNDIRTIPLDVLRKNIGLVPQETFLFSDTIKENITYGLDNGDDSRLVDAVTISQLKANIESFPDKYDTMLGEKGINLSGGQKQRAAISRAIIKEPKILILDDALSSVDTKTEEDILSRLRGVMKSRTSLIISHRISTVQDADLIFVLDDGKVVEEGSHESLLAEGGFYADLYKKQLLTEELDRVE